MVGIVMGSTSATSNRTDDEGLTPSKATPAPSSCAVETLPPTLEPLRRSTNGLGRDEPGEADLVRLTLLLVDRLKRRLVPLEPAAERAPPGPKLPELECRKERRVGEPGAG